jgi:hypothetical protein
VLAEGKTQLLPALQLERALEVVAKASGLKVEVASTRIEVCWEVADDEAEDSRPITLW